MKKILCIWIQAIATATCAQDFAITRFELIGDKVAISYSLVDTVANRRYTVRLYSSVDNFLHPVQKVSGDAGLEVAPGQNKKIVWNIGEELGAGFSGRVSIEIRGREYVPFITLAGFDDNDVRKRGVPFVVTWSGGTRQNVLNFDLYRGETKIWTQPAVGNTGNYELTIPKNVKPGTGYRFMISDSKNQEDVLFTDEFTIKRRIPLAVQAAVAAGAVGATLFLIDWRKTDTLLDPPCPDGTDECNN